MNKFKLLTAGALLAIPSAAFAEEYEVIALYDSNSIGGGTPADFNYFGMYLRSAF